MEYGSDMVKKLTMDHQTMLPYVRQALSSIRQNSTKYILADANHRRMVYEYMVYESSIFLRGAVNGEG